MERPISSEKDQESNNDRIQAFLREKGKLKPGLAGERDDRIFNAAMSCIELSIRPYERRLMSRALHDADRLEALLEDRPSASMQEPLSGLFSPAEFREFVTIVERELPQPSPEGPVPALFRNGAQLVAASYLWDDDEYLPLFHRIALELRAELRLLEDLLNWVDHGKRGDRIETLREAQSRMDSLEAESRSQHQEILARLGAIRETLGSINTDSRGEAQENALREIRAQLQSLTSELQQLNSTNDDDSALQTVARDVEARITGLSDVTTQVVQGQQEIVRMLLDLEDDERDDDDEEIESAVEQLRSLMLIGLVGIAVVAILVIVSITTG